jgi:CRISPR-associated protein Cas6
MTRVPDRRDETRMMVDLWFPAVGRTLPSDHGYALYGALCSVLPALHQADWWALHTVRGARVLAGTITLSRMPRIGIRVMTTQIAAVLPLSGRRIDVAGHGIGLGPPTVEALAPSATLSTRIATIKPFMEPEPFSHAAQKQLAEMGVSGTVSLGARKIVRIDGRNVVGFSVRVAGLSPESSLRLQEQGIGGRRHMGCGVFRRSERDLAADQRPLRAAAE